MTSASVRIGRIWGVPIGFHWSWLIVFALITASLAFGVLPQAVELPVAGYLVLGVLTSVLFFGSVLLHELGHTALALRAKMRVREINLFIFGGVAVMESEPPSAKDEFLIAIAGPITSMLLAGLFAAVWLLSGDFSYVAVPAMWLAWINLTLAVFNLIPGFPLDGGRVLRSIIWGLKGNLHRATQISSVVGQVVALGFIAWGVYTIVVGNFLGGLWIAFIGWFLQNASAATLAQSNLEESLKNVRVGDIMSFDYRRIPGSLPLQKLVDDHMLRGGGRCYFVSSGDDSSPLGLVTLNEIVRIPRENWQTTTASQVMVPIAQVVKIDWQDGVMNALRKIDESGVAQLPVTKRRKVIGVLSREQVLHQIRLRAELGIDHSSSLNGGDEISRRGACRPVEAAG